MEAERLDPLTAHYRDAGFTPKSEKRIAKSAGAEAKLKRRWIAEAERNPESHPRPENAPPLEFIAAALSRLEIHISSANWFQSHKALEHIADVWEAQRKMKSSGSRLPLNTHVTHLALGSRE